MKNMRDLRKICPTDEVYNVSSSLKAADLATRPVVMLAELGPGSIWQQGPSFLCLMRYLWPVTRDFLITELPDEEVKSKQVDMCASLSVSASL